jgi:hypothetical protein
MRADALKAAAYVLVLYAEHVRADVIGMRVTKRYEHASYRSLCEYLRIKSSAVNMLRREHRPHLPHYREFFRNPFRHFERLLLRNKPGE